MCARASPPGEGDRAYGTRGAANTNVRAIAWIAALLAILVAAPAVGQQQPPQQPAQPAGVWAKLPRMHLERQFAGPLPDTVIQRWRDPVDGMICYTYLPISAQHTAPTSTGFVQYGPNSIGSISCVGIATPQAPQAAKPPPSPR